MVDISELTMPDTAEIHIEHPQVGKLYADKDKTEKVTISVFSPASNEAIEYKRKVMKEASSIVAKKGIKAALRKSPEEMEEAEIERMVAMTSDVSNLQYKGEDITTINIHKVYRDQKMNWLTDQVRGRIGGWEDFLG